MGIFPKITTCSQRTGEIRIYSRSLYILTPSLILFTISMMVRVAGARASGNGSYGLSTLLRHLLSFALGVSVTVLFSKHRESSETALELVTSTQVPSATDASSRVTTTKSMVNGNDEFLAPPLIPDFYEIGRKTGTDKVRGSTLLPACLEDNKKCGKAPQAVNPSCRVSGHFYHTLYNKWLRPYATEETEPFSFLEIGFYHGLGYEAYTQFLSPKAHAHSIEISCIEAGERSEGKWPWGNFAAKSPRYNDLLQQNLLHCGDASDYDFLHRVWTEDMNQGRDAPLKVVVDDGSHLAAHMAASLFFWFPRIEPGGILVVEDIEPLQPANDFRLHVLPQVLKDLHYCGNDSSFKEKACFPTIQPLLQSVHCEMHICIFERNSHPAIEPSREDSIPPRHVLKGQDCLFGKVL